MTIVSIDIETTGLSKNSVITEIALYDPETSKHLHTYLEVPSWAPWEDFALANTTSGVNPRVRNKFSASAVDIKACDFLTNIHAEPGKVYALGWNVANFDRQFIARQLPRLDGWLSYRHIDLTGIRMLLESAEVDIPKLKDDYQCETWSEYADLLAAEVLGKHAKHDALWDTQQAAIFYEFAVTLLTK